MTWVQGLTLGIAMVGATLGVINTWHELRKGRVKLRVTPTWSMIAVGDQLSEKQLAIEVVNLSPFPVTVCDVGFLRRKFKDKRIVIIEPTLLDRGPWPRRLLPHDSVTVYTEDIQKQAEMLAVRRAYARTTSGVVRYGTSGALRQCVAEMKVKA